ncbi:hypothetical protein [Paenibacillus methanolicus]|uniref:Uncharacterized protein n=1 Tax=Paenibacillus methanolicus TaxID=582686 RepID=A0A5S5CEY0_9BACL|nr:hypothetical protein [Paenibacillus methanolicus]TYP77914.1 hypothetical protein BCM02_102483 [Paenibacillus methanolicus]
MPGNTHWTLEENAIIVGVIPEYRYLLNDLAAKRDPARTLARRLLDFDSSNMLWRRREATGRVKDEEDTIAQHIVHMEQVVAGVLAAERENEKPWFGLLPR